jgi:secondary thiamine-phosphate synthase enzyme
MMLETVNLQTGIGDSLTDITEQVRSIVKGSGVQSGVCHLVVPHTTAAITINSGLDPATVQDLVADVRRLVPTRTDFHHIVDTPSDAAAHIKASLVGNSETVLIEAGDLVFGHSQSLLFFDFDGPRQRRVMVKIIEG